VSVYFPLLATTKALELDAENLCGVELEGLCTFWRGPAHSLHSFAFPPVRLSLPDAGPAGQLDPKRQWRKELTVSDREKGTVKWFNGAKGYGFIQRTSGEDVFVHFSVIQENGYRTLNEGETVEYDLTKGPKGLQASNVVRA
jgi:CspA family cold shock protein